MTRFENAHQIADLHQSESEPNRGQVIIQANPFTWGAHVPHRP
jgi:hypothetical protein